MYISSGSCQGALAYDWYAFANSGTTNSGTWTQFALTSPNPGARQEGAMVYMPNVDRVLAYGGYNGAGSTSDDAWEYNPNDNTWMQICSGCAPGLRHGHIMVYDPPSGKVIIVGGERSYNGADIAATYLYNAIANTFSPASPVAEAPAVIYACHAYDRQRNRLLVGKKWAH